jgi:hypothetical protein
MQVDPPLTYALNGGELLLVLVHEVSQPEEQLATVPSVHLPPLSHLETVHKSTH